AELAAERLDGPRVRTGDDGDVDLRAVDLGALQRRAPGFVGQRQVLHLAEALLPRTGSRVAGRAPAVDELRRALRAADVLGDERSGTVAAHHDRRRAVAARSLVGARSEPAARVQLSDQHRA